MTIDEIIKQAMEEANLRPANHTKQANTSVDAGKGAPVVEQLNKLAEFLEQLGETPIDRIGQNSRQKSASSNTLKSLARTFIYQNMLKEATETALGSDTDFHELEKAAGDLEFAGEYLAAFKKIARDKYSVSLS